MSIAGAAARAVQRTQATVAPVKQSPFASVQNEAQLFAVLKAGSSSGQVPPRMMATFEDLYGSYKAAVLSSGNPGATEDYVARTMALVAERVLVQLTQPYTFPSAHRSIREPYDYYAFGQRYIRGLVDFGRSLLGHAERFRQVEAQLAAGDNVVLLANHQSEADPACWALLLEAAFPRLATEIIYVAGDRVVTDPLCAPFSMGRNLFCVHSKKHLDDIPELKAEKMATNRRTLKAMQSALAEGGQLLWIAPSGGRDRTTCPETGEFVPDAFDPSAVELMRALLSKAKGHAGHIWPLAMYTFPVLPPPKTVEKAIGEKRLVGYSPVGLSLAPELDLEALLAGLPEEDKEGRQRALAQAAQDAVLAQYNALRAALRAGPEAAGREWSQPWLDYPAVPLE